LKLHNTHGRREEPMKKGNIILLTLLIFTTFVFPYHAAFSEPSVDRRFPKEIARIPLPKLLDFGAGTCIPCKKMAPILQELSEEYKGRVVIKIIEVYDERELTMVNRIRLIPTQIFFDAKNQEVYRHVGFMDKQQIKKIFEKIGVNPVRKSSTF
jgi:thioredoxin 1